MRNKIYIVIIIVQITAVIYLINIISNDDTSKTKSGINQNFNTFIDKNKNVH